MAAGQERIPTPPEGLEFGAGLDEPTSVKARPKQLDAVEAVENAETRQKLKVVTDDDIAEAVATNTAPAGEPRKGGRGVIAALLVVLAGIGAAWVAKQSLLPPQAPPLVEEPPVAAAAADAGDDEEEDDDGGLYEDDDGGVDEPEDAGVLAALDAGPITDAGVADAGTPDGGAVASDAGAKPAPVKKPIKKKKKRRRRR